MANTVAVFQRTETSELAKKTFQTWLLLNYTEKAIGDQYFLKLTTVQSQRTKTKHKIKHFKDKAL